MVRIASEPQTHGKNHVNGKSAIAFADGATALAEQWHSHTRWAGVERPYSAADVCRLRGTMPVEHTLALRGAHVLWSLLQAEGYVPALGAVTGNQAVQMVAAGLKAI